MIIDELFEAPQQCPECGGISFSDLILAEKKDACYYKVKASAKVWPSAYASGRLVQCRKKGAANYGNKSEGVAEGRLNEDATRAEAQAAYMQGECMILAVAINQLNPERYPIGYIWEYNMSAGVPDMQLDDDEWESLSPQEQQEISKDISRHSVVHAYVRDRATGEYIDARGRHKTLPNLWGRLGQTRFEEFPGTARELIDITAHGDWDEVGQQVSFKRGQPAFDSLAGPAGIKRAQEYAVKYLGVEGSKNKTPGTDQQGVAEGEVIPFKRPQSPTAVSWQKLPKDVLTLANDWFWADFEGSGLDATMDPKGLGSGFANQQKYLGAQLQQRGWAIDIDDEFENVVLKNKQGQTILLPIEDAQTFSGWAKDTNPVTEQGVAEGGDVFKANIKDTAEYKAGLATSKLPVPHPEGTQEYANYYKGVIDKASPTLSKVGEDDANFGKSATLMTPSPQAAQKAKDIVQQRADANVISQAKMLGAIPQQEGEQQPGADYRDPREVDYDDEYDAMVARVKKLAGLGPMKTVYDPNKRQYRNMPTAVQPKK